MSLERSDLFSDSLPLSTLGFANAVKHRRGKDHFIINDAIYYLDCSTQLLESNVKKKQYFIWLPVSGVTVFYLYNPHHTDKNNKHAKDLYSKLQELLIQKAGMNGFAPSHFLDLIGFMEPGYLFASKHVLDLLFKECCYIDDIQNLSLIDPRHARAIRCYQRHFSNTWKTSVSQVELNSSQDLSDVEYKPLGLAQSSSSLDSYLSYGSPVSPQSSSSLFSEPVLISTVCADLFSEIKPDELHELMEGYKSVCKV